MILRKLTDKFFAIQFKILQEVKYSKEGKFNALPLTVFDCIKNTQNYSEFIPWCARSSIVKPISNAQNFTELTIRFQKVKELTYLSHVQIFGENNNDEKYKVQSICKDQPLKSLVSIWEIDQNSKIEGQNEQAFVKYSIEYEFSSPILQLTSHFFLDYVGESMWVIFKERAEEIQKSINLSKKHSFSNVHENEMTFGKSNRVLTEKIRQKQHFQSEMELNEREATNLSQYLGKNPKIHQIYCKNSEFKRKLDDWSKLIHGTKSFQQKLEFKIKNYLVHKN